MEPRVRRAVLLLSVATGRSPQSLYAQIRRLFGVQHVGDAPVEDVLAWVEAQHAALEAERQADRERWGVFEKFAAENPE